MGVFDIKCGVKNPAINLQLAAYWELDRNGITDGLEFNEHRHLFTLEATWEILPSVTYVLRKEGLSPDYSRLDPWYALRGRYVHKATEFSDNNTLDESTIDPEIAPYLEAYKRFRVEWGKEIIESEKRLYHPIYRYAGIIDRTIKGNKCHILYLRDNGTYRFPEVKNLRHHLNVFLSAVNVVQWKQQNLKEDKDE